MTSVHVVWTDGDGNVGLSWNMLEELFGTRVHTAHEGNGVSSVHVVHYIEVAHLIIGGGPADERLAADGRATNGAGDTENSSQSAEQLIKGLRKLTLCKSWWSCSRP